MNKWLDKETLQRLVAEEFTEAGVLRRMGLVVGSAARSRLRYYIELYGIDNSHHIRQSPSKVWKDMTKSRVLDAVTGAKSLTEVCEKLGVSTKGSSPNIVKRYIIQFGIDMSHLSSARVKGGKYWSTVKIPNDKLFVANSQSRADTVKNRILKDKLLDYVCSGCGNDGTWQGKQLTLQLEHKNGVSNDHRLTNLEFLCPNCHTQTSTWGSRNKNTSQ